MSGRPGVADAAVETVKSKKNDPRAFRATLLSCVECRWIRV